MKDEKENMCKGVKKETCSKFLKRVHYSKIVYVFYFFYNYFK